MTELLFIDVESVHLDPFEGSVWEVAWAPLDGPIVSHMVAPSLMRASTVALEVGRFFDRYDDDRATRRYDVYMALYQTLVDLDRPALVGSAPWFDAAHLLANWPGLRGLWHHHHVDVPTLLAGNSERGDPEPPWRLSQAAEVCGLDLGAYARHTAAGDVALTRDLYLRWVDG